MWERSYLFLWRICSVGDAEASEAEAEEETEAAERAMDATVELVEATAAVAAVEMEQGADAQVGVAPPAEIEDPEVAQGCGCAMTRIYLTCPFGNGKTCVLLCQGQSYP